MGIGGTDLKSTGKAFFFEDEYVGAVKSASKGRGARGRWLPRAAAYFRAVKGFILKDAKGKNFQRCYSMEWNAHKRRQNNKKNLIKPEEYGCLTEPWVRACNRRGSALVLSWKIRRHSWSPNDSPENFLCLCWHSDSAVLSSLGWLGEKCLLAGPSRFPSGLRTDANKHKEHKRGHAFYLPGAGFAGCSGEEADSSGSRVELRRSAAIFEHRLPAALPGWRAAQPVHQEHWWWSLCDKKNSLHFIIVERAIIQNDSKRAITGSLNRTQVKTSQSNSIWIFLQNCRKWGTRQHVLNEISCSCVCVSKILQHCFCKTHKKCWIRFKTKGGHLETRRYSDDSWARSTRPGILGT